MKSFLISFFALMSCVWSIDVSAYDFVVDGVYYNVIDLQQLTASVSSSPQASYTGDLIIPRNVTYNNREFRVEKVDHKAFDNCTKITSLYISDGVEMNVLPENCSSLTSLRLPSTGTSISGSCHCMALSELILPDSLETIAPGTCLQARNLQKLHLPAKVKKVGGMIGGKQTSKLTIDENNPYIKTRDGWIFNIDGDTLLSSLSSNVIDGNIVLPDEVEYVADEIFFDITIRDIHLPQALKVMSKMFSSSCKTEKYIEMTLPSKVECINKEALNGIGISKLVIPASVKRIMNLPFGTAYYADYTYENRIREFPLRTLIFEDSSEPLIVQCISYHPSENDQNLHLESLYLGRSLQLFNNEHLWGTSTTTADCVFGFQNKLHSLTVGKNCDNETLKLLFGQSGQVKTSALDTIVMNRIDPPMINVTFSNKQYMNSQLIVPKQCLEKYQSTFPWSNFWNISTFDGEFEAMLGDLNGDEQVDVSDVDVLIDMVLGKRTGDITAADLDGNGTIDVADVNLIIDIVLGKTVKQHKVHTFNVNGVEFKMIEIVGGKFQMGATAEQIGAHDDEFPVHQVELSSYYLGEFPVTRALWKAVMGDDCGYFYSEDQDISKLPVESVTWNSVQEFLENLEVITCQRFRLPTEAEWEYAARGGQKSQGYLYAGSDEIDQVAWYSGNSEGMTHTVGTKKPNELGLYDMSGNVWQLCSDWYGPYTADNAVNPTGPTSGETHVRRGGSFTGTASFCRVSRRLDGPVDNRSSKNIGFRLAL